MVMGEHTDNNIDSFLSPVYHTLTILNLGVCRRRFDVVDEPVVRQPAHRELLLHCV